VWTSPPPATPSATASRRSIKRSALADNIDAAGNIFLGREMMTPYGTLDDASMESETRKVMARLNPHFRRFKEPVKALSGGQRQSVAIARAIYFNARVLIMDEPTAALGPAETQQVADLVLQLKKEGIGIFLISHDIHDVFDLADRVSVMKNGRLVGSAKVTDVTQDEVLGMIILGKCPPGAIRARGRAEGRTSPPPCGEGLGVGVAKEASSLVGPGGSFETRLRRSSG
jgi:D-xylose transport system ATP-binding protein